MIKMQSYLTGLALLAAGLALSSRTVWGQAASSQTLDAGIINIDFTGARNVLSRCDPGPTYIGVGAVGSGTVWNGVLGDVRQSDGTDDDNITIISENLTNSLGEATTVGFTITTVSANNYTAGTDPNVAAALFGDYLFVGSAGQTSGRADFTISGLESLPIVDLYFYSAQWGATFTIPGASPAPFAGSGIFTPANTVYFARVVVTNGTVSGTLSSGSLSAVGAMSGLTIQKPLPQPFIRSAGPTGSGIRANTAINLELQDYGTQVAASSVQLLVNGQPVAATVSKPADSSITTVTYQPASNWLQASTNTFRIVFSDNAATPLVQTNDFTFVVLNDVLATTIINIDFNGARNVAPSTPGPTFAGPSVVGGGNVWNGIVVDSRLEDGTDEDNLTISSNNLVNSGGEITPISFTIAPVSGNNLSAGGNPAVSAALFGDYLFVGSAAQVTGKADFTISGLGTPPVVDLYFYYFSAASFSIPGAAPASFAANGIFTAANTVYFPKVPVTNGTVTGTVGTGSLTIICGMTIRKPLPQPILKSASPTGGGVRANTAINVEMQDYVTQVVPGTVQLLVNGQAVAATVSKPAGSSITTVTYSPAAGWVGGTTNTFRVVFSDNAATPVVQTNDFSFVVLNEAVAATILNIDFNGARNVAPSVPGATFGRQGAAGGGVVWNGIVVDSRLEDGTDDDNMTISGNNLVNSLGGATTTSFTIAPVSGNNLSAGSDPAASAALFGDYLFVGSAAQVTGKADFTLSGLGATPVVDLYFYYFAAASFAIPGASPTPLAASGIFTPANTVFFSKVAVTNGTVTGTVGTGGLTIICGMTIQKPLPQPFIKSASPAGTSVRSTSAITVELEDYTTQVVPGTVQLLVNGQAVAATVGKPAGSSTTTVTYSPAGGWVGGTTNTFRVIFGDNAATPVVQTNDFTFVALNEAQAAATINIDFDGAANYVPPPDPLGPTYAGVGAAGGGSVFNGIIADSRDPDGITSIENLTIGGTNLVNSLGDVTPVSFTASLVIGDANRAGPVSDPTSSAALLGDYIVIVPIFDSFQGPGEFTISGLGTVSSVDLYFYWGVSAVFGIPGASSAPFAGSGIFTPANTLYYANVPVTNGIVTGTIGSSTKGAASTVVYGMTLQKPFALPQPGPLSIALQGNTVILSWPGTAILQAADELRGQWVDIATTSPQSITPTADHKFYRLRR